MPPPSPRERQAQARKKVSARRWVKEAGSSERTLFTIPSGFSLLRPTYGVYRFDILPFEAKRNLMADPGEMTFETTFYAHYSVGPANGAFICPAMTWNEPCPICEDRQALFDTKDPDDKKRAISLKPKRRQLWCVIDCEQRAKGPQIMEIADYNFGEQLRTKIDNCDPKDADRYNSFADPDDGSTIRVVFKKETGDGFTFPLASDIEFRSREVKIDPKILAKVPCLDDLLVYVEYDKLKSIYVGAGKLEKPPDDDGNIQPGEHEDVSQNGSAGTHNEPADEGENTDTGSDEPVTLSIGMAVIHDTHGECEIVYISRDGSKVTIEDSEKNEHQVTPEELSVADNPPAEDPEPEPPPKPARTATRATAAKPAARPATTTKRK